MTISPYALKAGEGWKYRFGVDFVVKAGEIGEGSSAAVMEYVTRKGEEPSPHSHPRENEMFYVLEGAIEFTCGDQTFSLGPGGFIFLPAVIKHGYTIPGEQAVRLLVITSPPREDSRGGWGGFVSDLELGQGELVARPGDPG